MDDKTINQSNMKNGTKKWILLDYSFISQSFDYLFYYFVFIRTSRKINPINKNNESFKLRRDKIEIEHYYDMNPVNHTVIRHQSKY